MFTLADAIASPLVLSPSDSFDAFLLARQHIDYHAWPDEHRVILVSGSDAFIRKIMREWFALYLASSSAGKNRVPVLTAVEYLMENAEKAGFLFAGYHVLRVDGPDSVVVRLLNSWNPAELKVTWRNPPCPDPTSTTPTFRHMISPPSPPQNSSPS